MSNIIDTLVEMGFPKHRAELAVSKTKANNVEDAMEWLLTNEEPEHDAELVEEPNTSVDNSIEINVETNKPTEEEMDQSLTDQMAKSLKCEECGKLFSSNTEVEFHAAKTGHSKFAQSTEEKKPLTEEEKREQLARIEAKLKQRRLEREARERAEELEREKNRIKSGKELLEAKKKHDDLEIKKMVELKKREKEEERLARQRVKEQIEQDKLARKAKFGGQTPQSQPSSAQITQPVTSPSTTTANKNYSEVKLQIKLTNGTALVQTFGAKEPLSAVRLYVEMNRTDEPGQFTLMTPFPRKVFGADDFDKPLDLLGLAPSAVLIVSKST